MNDQRLLACARLCKGKKAVDVGTDHGHLAAYLITSGICDSCIACDINEKPLKAAEDTVKRFGLDDKIQLVLSDGLDKICPDGVTDIVIAGMGGELIADIIDRAEWIKADRVNLVLQPMTKWDHLRKWLYDNGFEVVSEIPCEEGRFVYSVMQAVYTGVKPDYKCDTEYLYAGRVAADTEDGRKYLLRQAERLETAGRGMINSREKRSAGEEYIWTAKMLKKIASANDRNENDDYN
ncbi:class I SAM-dependent methyltransferase [Ruminococcus sp. Marseille-P6503]|uniref:class I SAM-dependent methyltransferase n=1 Tax=Ruminococcus sp. Marseille-P6503 TaxID=2364796 RepID=UPI000F521B3F|nr:class I SAM-dependent methyltransferase [Ruminococcus sp. Marseille-P6503]